MNAIKRAKVKAEERNGNHIADTGKADSRKPVDKSMVPSRMSFARSSELIALLEKLKSGVKQ